MYIYIYTHIDAHTLTYDSKHRRKVMQRNSPIHLETSLQWDLDVLQSRRFQRKYSLGFKKK